MADLFYRVTAGADEASARNLLKSNSLLVELVCGQHSDLLQSDAQVAACDVARKMIKLHFSTWRSQAISLLKRWKEEQIGISPVGIPWTAGVGLSLLRIDGRLRV